MEQINMAEGASNNHPNWADKLRGAVSRSLPEPVRQKWQEKFDAKVETITNWDRAHRKFMFQILGLAFPVGQFEVHAAKFSGPVEAARWVAKVIAGLSGGLEGYSKWAAAEAVRVIGPEKISEAFMEL